MVRTCWIDAVFVGDDFPKLRPDLVSALATLHVDKFSHLERESGIEAKHRIRTTAEMHLESGSPHEKMVAVLFVCFSFFCLSRSLATRFALQTAS